MKIWIISYHRLYILVPLHKSVWQTTLTPLHFSIRSNLQYDTLLIRHYLCLLPWTYTKFSESPMIPGASISIQQIVPFILFGPLIAIRFYFEFWMNNTKFVHKSYDYWQMTSIRICTLCVMIGKTFTLFVLWLCCCK